MESLFVKSLENERYISNYENKDNSIFKQYEDVVIQSLITTFGLDFLVKDQHGGDVDTIHNVRQIGKDENMYYKDKRNEKAYENIKYDKERSKAYHSHPEYKRINKLNSELKKEGKLVDNYTGEILKMNESSDLDHVISAKEIETDRGRVLSGLSGEDLANTEYNLKITNSSVNRSKKDKEMIDFINKLKSDEIERNKRIKILENKKNLSNKEKKEYDKLVNLNKANHNKMKLIDRNARKEYNKKLNIEYYTSKKFISSISTQALKSGAGMATREVFGLLFAEIWFSVKNKFNTSIENFNISDFITNLLEGIKEGFKNFKNKFKSIWDKVKDSAFSGIISNLMTSLINIFTTTIKNVVKIIRETWRSIIEAFKILIFNPDKLGKREKLKAVSKVIATGVSVVLGTIIMEYTNKFLPEYVSKFIGILSTGILSCTLLYFIDNSAILNFIYNFLESNLEKNIRILKNNNKKLEKYILELESLCEELSELSLHENLLKILDINSDVDAIRLNTILEDYCKENNIRIPYLDEEGNDIFEDKSKVLNYNN